VIEPHRSRTSVDLTGLLTGPVAIDPHAHVVLLADDGVVSQLAADGNIRWSFLVGPPGGAPALGPDGAVFVASRDGRLYALDDDGALLWSGVLGGRPVRGVAIGPDRVDVALDTGVLAQWNLDGELVAGTAGGSVARVRVDGSIDWRIDAGGPVHLSPVFGEDGTTFVAAGSAVVAIAPTGGIIFRRDLEGPVLAGPLVADDGAIYMAFAAGDGGRIRALAPDGTSRRIDLPAPPSRSLSLDAGQLWVGLENGTLRRIAVPQRGLASSSWPKARRDHRNTGSF
jgi:outer membrane protein assembly factor BamB